MGDDLFRAIGGWAFTGSIYILLWLGQLYFFQKGETGEERKLFTLQILRIV
jgi:hypothetical protein